MVQTVRQQSGAIASFNKAVVVDRLAKTWSGKILGSTLRRIADGESYKVRSTIDDPAILPEIEAAVGSIACDKS